MNADPTRPRTLGEAIPYFGDIQHGCACFTSGPDCCVRRYGHADNLHRAAHIVARQLADLRDREAERAPGFTSE